MARLWDKTVNITYNPSGAAAAARQGNLVMVVDIIDMSTTAETALTAGAIDVLGASIGNVELPVTVNPEKIGYIAGKRALKHETGIILAIEPRIFSADNKAEREKNIQPVLKGIKKGGAEVKEIIPNLGKEIGKMVDLKGELLIIISASGGACFDAAYNYGAPAVITGTVARAGDLKGDEPALRAAERAMTGARKLKTGISIVAASSNSREDILAAEYIAGKIIGRGFLNK